MSNYAKRKQAEALQKKENTKKTMISVGIFVLVVVALIGFFWFGKQLRQKETTASGDPNYDVMDYVTLGNYEGLEVYYVTPEVTDEDVQNEIDAILEAAVEYTEFDDREVASGDKVTIAYTGTLDGEEFDSSEGYTYTLGEGSMIEGFDEELYGMKTGDEVEFEITFPEDYQSEELAGQLATFEVTLTKAEEITYQPEWNDEFVKENSEDKYSTTVEYEAAIREELLEQATASSDSRLANDIWAAVCETATVDGYPEYLYNTLYASISTNIESTASSYGLTTDQYMSIFGGGLSMDEYVLEYVNSQLIAQAIIKDMNLELSDEKYEELATAELEYYGVETIEELEETYGEETLREFYLDQYMRECIKDLCVIKEVSADEYETLMADTEAE